MKKCCFKPNKGRLIFLFSLLLLLSACIKDHFDFDKLTTPAFNGSLAFPIVTSELNLRTLLEQTSVNFNDDPATGFVSLVYEFNEIFTQSVAELVEIPNQFFDIPRTINYVPPLPGEFYIYEYSHLSSLNTQIESQRVDSLFFTGGVMRLVHTTDINYASRVLINSPSLIHRQTGAIFSMIRDLPFSGSTPYTFDSEVDLSTYVMVFDFDPDVPNAVAFDFVLEISGDQNAVPYAYAFDTEIFLDGITFGKIVGYLGQYDIDFEDSLSFDIFDNLLEGNFELDQHSVNLVVTVHNSFGMPVFISVDPFQAVSPVNAPFTVDIELFGSGIPNEFTIGAPAFSQIGQTFSTVLETNSNIGEAINLSPTTINFAVNGVTNPTANPDDLNFATDSSQVSIDLLTKLELYGRLKNFVLKDTLEFSLELPNEIQSAEFLLHIVNGFPLDIDLQLYFADKDYRILDSLMMDQTSLIRAASVGPPPDFKVLLPTDYKVNIPVTEQKMQNISDAENILVRGRLETSNGDYVKIYSDYDIKVKLSAIFNVSVNP
jgi:hypothetical protein